MTFSNPRKYTINGFEIAMFLLSGFGLVIPFIEGLIREHIYTDYSKELGWYLGFVVFSAPMLAQINSRITRLQKQNEDSLNRAFDIREIGGKEASLSEIRANVLAAKTVRNTFIESTSDSSRKATDRDIQKLYEEWLSMKNDGSWEDVVGIQEFFSERYKSITVPENSLRKKTVYVLREGTKIMNFLVLGDGVNEKAIVYFGWLPDDKGNDSKIFRSENEQICGLFRSHFELLKGFSWNRYGKSEPVNDGYSLDHSRAGDEKLQVSKGLVDKKGTWISLAFRKDVNDKIVFDGSAFLDIRFASEKVSVKAMSFDSQGNYKNRFTSHSDSAFYLNNIFISYKLGKASNDLVTGVCHYQFIRHDRLGDIFLGVFGDHEMKELQATVGFREEFNLSQIKESMLNDTLRRRVAALEARIQNLDSSDRFKVLSGPEVSD